MMIFYSFSNNFSLKILNDLNDRDLNDRLHCYLHAAGNSERSGYCGENADRNLNHHFPSILLHRLLLFRDLHCRRHRLHCRYCRRWYPGHRWFRYRQLPAFRCLQFR